MSVFLLSTYTGGAPPDTVEWFCRWINEASDDFRVSKSLLAGVKFTVFALGHSLYDTNYCLAGKNLFDWLSKLSARPVYPLRLGDQNVAQSDNGGRFTGINFSEGSRRTVIGHTIWLNLRFTTWNVTKTYWKIVVFHLSVDAYRNNYSRVLNRLA